MLSFSFLTLAVAFLSVSATPVVEVRESKATLPIIARLNATGRRIPDIDRARAKQQVAGAKARASKESKRAVASFSIINEAVTYVANVGIGSPARTYQLLIDTGSSNTWTNAAGDFVSTSTTRDTGEEVEVEYGSGFFFGELVTDTVTLAPGLVIPGQAIGIAEISEGFDGVDGILGIGPTILTEDTTSGGGLVPTVSDNLASLGVIPEEVVTVFFAPTTVDEITNGALTFGEADTTNAAGAISFIPKTTTSPADEFWGIDQSITYGTASGQSVQSTAAGIVDTGTTLFLLETNAFNTYVSLTGATEDDTTGLLTITAAKYADLQSLILHAGGTTFEFTKNAQTWPRSLNTAIGGAANSIFLVVGDLGDASDVGFSFVDGFVFLERFLSVFDTTNNQVGFATTAHTDDETN